MSGIAGIIHFDGRPVEPGQVEQITGAMATRGPDATHHWRKGKVALGHCMLRTTPESLDETQPLISDDGTLVLVFDGRLDNRDDIRRAMQLQGITPRSPTDAELVMGAYRLWGEDSPQRLLGDFAYAIWDERQQKMFCARDHMGARPFYYVCNASIFAFASEDEALLGLPGVSNLPNEELIAQLLVPAFNDFDTQPAWLKDVSALMPAQSLVMDDTGAPRITTYWRLEPGEESVYASDQACQEAFLAVFGEAVRCRMRSAGPVAAMMSGGLDSAGIAAMVKRLLPEMPGQAFHTYSAISDHPETCVESQCIQSLTQDLGDHAHFVSVPSFQGMASVQDLIHIAWSKAHPTDNSILLLMMMCQAASRHGHRVMLHGASGDLTMYVPDRYPAHLMRAGQWRQAWRECQGASRNNTFLRGTSPFKLLLLNAGAAFLPAKLKPLARRLRGQASPLAHSVIKPALAQRLRLAERLRKQAEAQGQQTNLRKTHAEVIHSPSLGIVLGLTGCEHMAGRYGIELRDPWADKRVVEFFVRLPLRYKVRDGWTKYLVRTTFEQDLPTHVLQRLGKEHLGRHFPSRLMTETAAFVAQTLEKDLDNVLKAYVDLEAVRTRYQHLLTQPDDAERDFVSEVMTLLLWLKRTTA